MAIIVDKVQKRKDIALSCIDLLLEKGIKKLTVSEVAIQAGVSKGSIYDYFENKEDIVFEIIRNDIENYQDNLYEQITPTISTREKVFLLFDFLLSENDMFQKHQNIYKEYVSINLGTHNDNMSEFNKECSVFFKTTIEKLIKEGITKGEIIEDSLKLVGGFLAVEKGFLMIHWTEGKDVKGELKEFINMIFDLIEVKK
ncbi:MAG: TetR/AcrR family transcriptional regulator [Arcobacteraceae bacterium]|nr:TetR/AcrR family transcriptional regulator [Arcobacteraceae bacterium]